MTSDKKWLSAEVFLKNPYLIGQSAAADQLINLEDELWQADADWNQLLRLPPRRRSSSVSDKAGRQQRHHCKHRHRRRQPSRGTSNKKDTHEDQSSQEEASKGCSPDVTVFTNIQDDTCSDPVPPPRPSLPSVQSLASKFESSAKQDLSVVTKPARRPWRRPETSSEFVVQSSLTRRGGLLMVRSMTNLNLKECA